LVSPGAERRKIDIHLVAGARPNFMKIAPLLTQLENRPAFRPILIHTGQHYDDTMSRAFFQDLELRPPDVNLGVGSGSQAQQTGRIMSSYEQLVLDRPPDLAMVVGDVNSTVACSLVAAKLHIPVAHVEAGLRSFDRTMPEEINRILTDAISDFLFTTCSDADRNLLREGIAPEKVFFVGNVMIDSLMRVRETAARSDVLARLGLKERSYALMTLHRPSNVDQKATLQGILAAVERIQTNLPVVFPVHPRSRKMFGRFGLEERIAALKGLRLIDPLGYIDFVRLMDRARLVLTDSGGIQEETTVLGVPCLTLRENTERPVTVRQGTNRMVGSDPQRIVAETDRILREGPPETHRPPLWDGAAADRIVDILSENMLSSAKGGTKR
jgi:UDP-N-acetylglucosamine 2-epimerase (non-hydrolysing)